MVAGFVISVHAEERMIERGIKKKYLRNLLKKSKPQPHAERMTYNNGVLKAVVDTNKNIVTTVYWVGKQSYRNYVSQEETKC
jgi:hypothetical protein